MEKIAGVVGVVFVSFNVVGTGVVAGVVVPALFCVCMFVYMRKRVHA